MVISEIRTNYGSKSQVTRLSRLVTAVRLFFLLSDNHMRRNKQTPADGLVCYCYNCAGQKKVSHRVFKSHSSLRRFEAPVIEDALIVMDVYII